MNVGYTTGIEEDSNRTNWDGSAARPLAWSAWYPCSGEDEAGRLHGQFFDLGIVRVNVALAAGGKFPVVLLSHGTGGSPESMGWLARKLAQHGYVVIGAHHHGNTGREPYRAEGFLCWWERATDMSALLSMLSAQGPFADRLDLDRASAAGFSLGAYSVLAMAGAITSMDRYLRWASDFQSFEGGPREMPDAASHIPRLIETSKPFQASWARQSNSFRDIRFRTVVALAPPPPVRGFDRDSLGLIAIPVTLITGEADVEAPPHECADWLMQNNPSFRRVSVGEDVGHYTFLGFPAEKVHEEDAVLFSDNKGVSRADVHERTAKAVLSAIK
ncbi:MAG: hypothetical protein Q8P60_13550 [Pseudorhodobacter sp.]|nr:hypothetical protein [Pseudorhodobacter sp.]